MPKHHYISELWTDPSSGDLSTSRLCLLLLCLDVIGLSIADLFGLKFSGWAQLAIIIGSVAGVYGINTGLRVWRGKVYTREEGEK